MYDNLKSIFANSAAARSGSILKCVGSILKHFSEESLKEGIGKNAAIDALIDVLEEEKDPQ